MAEIAFAIPGDIDTPTGGTRYDRAVIAALRQRGDKVDHIVLGDGFPAPSEAELADAADKLTAVSPQTPLMVDGLAYAVLPEALLQAVRVPIIALVHHPLALETGLSAETARAFHAAERGALTFARQVIVTSAHTARGLVSAFGVPASRITVAHPGLSGAYKALNRAPVHPPRLISVGTVSPRKGHDVLVKALAEVTDLEWSMEIVGSLDPGGELARALSALIDGLGLSTRITLAGALTETEIATRYEAASLFVLATRYEGFGMVFAEAMAAGLPVIGTTAGAVPDVVPQTAGRLVEPGNVAALAAALRELLGDEALRDTCAEGARRAGAAFGDWADTAAIVADVAQSLR